MIFPRACWAGYLGVVDSEGPMFSRGGRRSAPAIEECPRLRGAWVSSSLGFVEIGRTAAAVFPTSWLDTRPSHPLGQSAGRKSSTAICHPASRSRRPSTGRRIPSIPVSSCSPVTTSDSPARAGGEAAVEREESTDRPTRAYTPSNSGDMSRSTSSTNARIARRGGPRAHAAPSTRSGTSSRADDRLLACAR